MGDADSRATPDMRGAWWVVACCAIPLFAVCVNTTSVNTALPAIADELNADMAGLQWVVNSYILVAAAFVVTGGQLGDLLGRRRMLLVGVGLFGAASLLIALSESVGMLIVGRSLQGLGSAIIVPVTLSLVGVAFPPERRTAAIGVWAAVIGIGFALGPLIGGALTVSLGWEWVWWANLPVVLLGVLLTLGKVPESRDETREPAVDVAGIALLGAGSFALLLAITEGRSWGWSSARVLGLFAAAALLFGVFGFLEQRRRAPLVHLRFFRIPEFAAANAGTFAANFVLLGAFYIFNLYLQSFVALDYSAVAAGAALLPLSLTMFVVSLVAGPLAGRFGARWPVTGGFVLVAVGMLLLSDVSADSGFGALVPGFVLMGVGLGLVNGPTSAAAVAAVPTEDAGEASGVVNMARYLGGALGVALGAVVYLNAGIAKLNETLGAERVGTREEARLDQILSGAASTGREAVAGVPPRTRGDIVSGASDSVVDAFAAASRLSMAIALLGALSCVVLLRRPHERERHHPLHRAAAPGTAVATAHHHAPT
jgi:DHA2 family methylenomycin A resistance protein-like MFS transporter